MRILGIESSCDETAVAIVDGTGDNVSLVSSFIRSQIDIHEAYGGVIPEVAAREHLQMMFPMLHKAVAPNGEGIDAIAVTVGPGLAPALRVGVETAKALAYAWGKPLVPVCHLEGHIYAVWITACRVGEGLRPSPTATPQFPALCLIVSGGHTELVLMKGHGEYERLGETVDDAAGEAFDKVAKMMGLGYPGGPKVAELAQGGDRKAFDFPRAMNDNSLNFSFSGLKTSVLYMLRAHEAEMQDVKFRENIAASFEEAVVDVLVKKTRSALLRLPLSPLLERGGAPILTEAPIRSLILAGGVAANLSLRKALEVLAKEMKVSLHLPPFEFSLDNAAMIATAGYFRACEGKFADPLLVKVDPNMDIV
ncbi:MAG: tRNA (adenosine(37)-N6)-threonylcarbamoyltransferase complex transferase subunit TsaD [Patescibacteria group bacterium]|jgi:N6-L-threonylcarbamoyladenine synthase